MEDGLLILVGLALLFVGGEWLVKAATRLATSLGISALVIGLTVVAFGTSAPELVVSISAALNGVSDIALGNVVGSNIANIGLIMGLAGIIYPITIRITLVRREIPFMIALSFMVWLLAGDGMVGAIEGIAMLIGYVIFIGLLYRASQREPQDEEMTEEVAAREGLPIVTNRWAEVARLLTGLLLLIVGAQWTVAGATNLARAVGISELVIGLTLVSVGTSLPEIATSLIAAWRKHSDIVAGNVIGSNIANLLVILGTTSMIQPITVNPRLLLVELPLMIGFSLVLFLFILNRRLERWQAGALLAGYGVFTLSTLVG